MEWDYGVVTGQNFTDYINLNNLTSFSMNYVLFKNFQISPNTSHVLFL